MESGAIEKSMLGIGLLGKRDRRDRGVWSLINRSLVLDCPSHPCRGGLYAHPRRGEPSLRNWHVDWPGSRVWFFK